jgi:putative ABC transport system permease protein
MGIIKRGFKNAFRNTTRTISIVVILAASISMSLIMVMSLKTVQAKINDVKSSIGNTITVSPAGIRGFEGGGTLLTSQNATDIKNISHVSTVNETLSDRLTNSSSTDNFPGASTSTNNKTNLTSPIQPGSFGNRQRQEDNSSNSAPANFSMPINVSGVNDLSLSSLGVSQFNVTSGTKIDPASSKSVAMIGKDLASKNNLSVGSTFQGYGVNIQVVGIYDSGNTFTNASIIMPIATVQNLSGQSGQINSIIVQTDSIDSISGVQTAIKNKLGSSVDVTSSQDQSSQAIAPLQNIKTISTYSLIGSLVAGAVIILLTMVMIVRERRREIGVLKAIGASNATITTQFIIEAMVLTIMSSIVGMILGLILSNPVLKVLVNNATSSTASSTSGFRGGGGGGQILSRIGSGVGAGARNIITNLHAVIGWEIILYGFLAAIVIAIIGSAIPAFLISKIRPAEVLRSE